MTTAGEARMYLQEGTGNWLDLSVTHIISFSREASDTLKKAAQGIYQLTRNLRRNKDISRGIPAILQICYKKLMELSNEASRKISPKLNPAEKEALKRKLLVDLEKVRKKIQTVGSLLVTLEKEGQRNRQHMSV